MKGKAQLTFVDSVNTPHVLNLKIIDTTETVANDCGDFYPYQYLNATLYLYVSKTDSIYFSLASADWLCMQAFSNNTPNISMCNVFGQTKEGLIAKRLNDYTISTHRYKEVVLMNHN